MRKSHIWLIFAVLLLVIVSAGVTVALLVASSNPVINTFTVGGVDITLKETTGQQYIMTPGVAVAKDPVITVLANSEKSWLFVKLEKKNSFDTYCTYELREGWTALPGQPDVFYRMVEKASTEQAFEVLKDNSIFIKSTLTEEQLGAVTQLPTLTFTAYAVQSDGFATPDGAWAAVNQGREE